MFFNQIKTIVLDIVLSLLIFLIGIAIQPICCSAEADRGDADGVWQNSNSNTIGLLKISEAEKTQLVQAALSAMHDYLSGQRHFKSLSQFQGLNNRVWVVLWRNGTKLYSWYTRSDNLSQSVYNATTKVMLHRNIKSAKDIDIHIHILGEEQPYNPSEYIHGIHGLSMGTRQKAIYYGSYCVEGNYKPSKLYSRLKAKLQRKDPVAKPILRSYFNEIHFAKPYGQDLIVTYFRGNTPQLSPLVTVSDFHRGKTMAEEWLAGALWDRGEFKYLYYPSRDEYPQKRNNVLRQLMASRTLSQMAVSQTNLLKKHKLNLEYAFSHWYRQDGEKGYILYRNKSKLGAMAMALRTLVYSPFFEAHKQKAAKLVHTILSLQKNNGSMQPWYIVPDGYQYDKDRLLTFYSGEAILSLVEYYLKTGDKKVLSAAIKSQDYYVQYFVDEIEKHYYPAYVPWHSMSLSKLYKISRNPRYAQAIFIMTDRLLEIQNQNAGREPDLLGRFYNPATPQYGTPHASSDAVYTEGLAYAYEIAHLLNDRKRIGQYGHAIRLAVHHLLNLQYREYNMYFVKGHHKVKGAIRIHVTDNKIRIDTTQHTLDAFTKIEQLINDGLFSFQPQKAELMGISAN